MLLHDLTWQEVEAYLKRARGIVLPIGSTEQHGPDGPIGTDTICAETIARGVGERTGALVAPALAYTQAQFNLEFPGTISVRARTVMALVGDIVESLAAHGFTHFYWVNAHGANLAPLQAAFQDLHADRSLGRREAALRFRVRSWWEPEPVNRLRQELFAEHEGLHATPSEISITQAVLAGNAKQSTDGPAPVLSAEALSDHRGDNHLDARAHRASFPDGRVGSDPALARASHGDALVEAAVAALAEDYVRFLEE